MILFRISWLQATKPCFYMPLATGQNKGIYFFFIYQINKHQKCKTKVLIFFFDKNSLTLVIFLVSLVYHISIVLNYSHVRICWRSNAANLWNCVILFAKYFRGINVPLNHAKGSHGIVRTFRQCLLNFLQNEWFLKLCLWFPKSFKKIWDTMNKP